MSIAYPVNPKCYTVNVPSSGTYGGAYLTTFTPSTCVYVQFINHSLTTDVLVKLNGDSNAIFNLAANTSQVLEKLHITSIDFANVMSGGGTVSVTIIAGVTTV